MAIHLVLPTDPRTQIKVEVPVKLKNGKTKNRTFMIPKMGYIDREIMTAYRDWVEDRQKERKEALDRVAAKEKDVEIPPVLTDLDVLENLAKRVFPDEYTELIDPLPDGVKQQLFTEWTEQSKVTPGEFSASASSSDNQE